MLRIAESFHASDLGRQRQGNEDNYFVRAPLFVVADGMGGAQAGEVASEMAVESFDRGLPDEASPAESLVSLIEGANERIYGLSQADQQRAGMGTTVTAAYVGEDAVTVAHVGDSRCYLWRGGDLVRLTRDHSLVGELVARGKLTEEQAESHPQRSVITRSVGPEPRVQVDVDVFPARDGDVFLLCSDGLTSMVFEPQLAPILAEAASLEQAGRRLIRAANEAGGRDNITVILFRLEDVATGGAREAATAAGEADTSEYDTFEGDAVPAPRPGVTRPTAEGRTRVRDEETLDSRAVRAAVAGSDEAEADYRASGTVALTAVRPRAAPDREAPPPRAATRGADERPARRRRRVPAAAIIALCALLGVLAAGWVATRSVYFLGTDPANRDAVTLYQGLPYDLPLGIHLYSKVQVSGVSIDSVPAARRATFTNHELRPRKDAEGLVRALEQGTLR